MLTSATAPLLALVVVSVLSLAARGLFLDEPCMSPCTKAGDHTLISRAVYGGVYRLTTQFLCQFGLEFSFVDTSDLECVRSGDAKVELA